MGGSWRSAGAARPRGIGRGFAVLLLAGCSSSVTGPGVGFERSAARWDARGPDAYSFIFDQVCECPPPRTVLLAVVGGDVVGAQALPGTTPPVELDPADYLTIDELFERLRRDAAANPVVFDVTFDPELGYPRTAEVDVSADIADDEYRFEVSEVSRMERLE